MRPVLTWVVPSLFLRSTHRLLWFYANDNFGQTRDFLRLIFLQFKLIAHQQACILQCQVPNATYLSLRSLVC